MKIIALSLLAAAAMLGIATINVWNRLNVATRQIVGASGV